MNSGPHWVGIPICSSRVVLVSIAMGQQNISSLSLHLSIPSTAFVTSTGPSCHQGGTFKALLLQCGSGSNIFEPDYLEDLGFGGGV